MNWSGPNVEALLNTIPVPILIVDANQSRAVMNDALCAFLGRNRDFLLNGDVAWQMSLRSADLPSDGDAEPPGADEFSDLVTSEFCGPPAGRKDGQVLRRRLHAGGRSFLLEAAFDPGPRPVLDLAPTEPGAAEGARAGTGRRPDRLLLTPRTESLIRDAFGRLVVDNGLACDCELYIDGEHNASIGARERRVVHLPSGLHVASLTFADGHERLISDPFRVSGEMVVTLPLREIRDVATA
ncbi:hypothetical protein [Sphingomonas sp. KR3-1]|uniref:hypothetical protein n=1 Tax=Sphingomonas sp. KR3-1 TaxID=3156611 RepID=UPI0032B37AE1